MRLSIDDTDIVREFENDENYILPVAKLDEGLNNEEIKVYGEYIVKAVNNHEKLFNALNRLFNVIDWSDMSEDVREAYLQAQDAINEVVKE